MNAVSIPIKDFDKARIDFVEKASATEAVKKLIEEQISQARIESGRRQREKQTLNAKKDMDNGMGM